MSEPMGRRKEAREINWKIADPATISFLTKKNMMSWFVRSFIFPPRSLS